MAPELFVHKPYNESIDVFSFGVTRSFSEAAQKNYHPPLTAFVNAGILLLSLLARIDPDPDEIRAQDFSVDESKFRRQYAGDCPEDLLKLAFRCACAYPAVSFMGARKEAISADGNFM
jgi:hypothetical protein